MSTESFKRKLSAIFSADVAGYSRLMSQDEIDTISRLKEYRHLMVNHIQRSGGRVVDSPGDNILAEFTSVVEALECAVDVQKELKKSNEALPPEKRMEFRIGINLGDIIEDDNRIYGDGVNIAARIEGLADPGGICISHTTHDAIGKKLPLGYAYLGEHLVKNIEKPIRVYRVLTDPESAGKVIGETASLDRMAFPLPEKPSITVLPFVNMSEDKSQEYFSDGLTEEIITALAKTPKLFVIARESSFTYKGKPVKVQQVSEELGVRYVLEGSVRKEGNRVRITAQLIDATTGNHLWADRYDRELKEIFALQDEITLKIISSLPVKLTSGDVAGLHAPGTESLEAYLKLLEGSEPLNSIDLNAIPSARKKLEEAIALDPKFARAYALLGFSYGYDFALGRKREESMKKAFECLQKARSLDDSLINIYTTYGLLYSLLRQHEKAIASDEKALSLAPGSALAHFAMGRDLNLACRDKLALNHLEKALRLNPFPPAFYFQHIGAAHFNLGNHGEAVSALKRTLSMTPLNNFAIWVLMTTYVEMGRMEEASALDQEVAKTLPTPRPPPETYRKVSIWKDPKVTERYVEAERKLRDYHSSH